MAEEEIEPMPTRKFSTLPPECQSLCFNHLSLRDIGHVAASCKDLHAVTSDPSLWVSLLRSVWLATPPASDLANARQVFIDRFFKFTGVSCQCFDVSEGPWLEERQLAGRMQQLAYSGSSADASHDHSVGCAIAKLPRTSRFQTFPSWPVGTEAGSRMSVAFFETKILSAGDQGFIAIGWAREGFPKKCRQPGWDAHTFGYHGDDGRCYHHSGYGRRFHGPFTSGQTIGTGVITLRGSKRGCIFFTVDGVLVGTPFASIARPALLRPSLGLHSPNELVEPTIGGNPESLLSQSPPTPPTPFAFDLNSFLTADLPRCLDRAERNAAKAAAAEAAKRALESITGTTSAADAYRAAIAAGGASATATAANASAGNAATTLSSTEADDDDESDSDALNSMCKALASTLAHAPSRAPSGAGHAASPAGNAATASAGGSGSNATDDDSESDASASLQQELDEVAGLVTSHDESEAALTELVFYARSRLGPQADQMHASWGATRVEDIQTDRLRQLCWMLLQQE